MSGTKAPEALLEEIRNGNRFLIVSHINPDGDAIGSALGLARILKRLGKGALVWNLDEIPKIYRRLVGSERVHIGQEEPKGFPQAFDRAVILECPTLDRTGLAEQLDSMTLLNIDHHLGNEHYGIVNWVDTGAPSLGEMIHRLAGGLMVDLDPDTATALYLTLVTDTGSFRFANSTAKAFKAAAALVSDGARPDQVAEWLYESQPESGIRLLGQMLHSLEVHSDGRVATVLVTQEMFDRAGATRSDTEGLIDHPRSIAGVQAVALLRQVDDHGYKVSLRSRGEVNVEKIARRYGGGGHRNASGFLAEDVVLEELRLQVVGDLTDALS
jgi:phosphoesterase RecJ-like protein